jgi:hypothetical protein
MLRGHGTPAHHPALGEVKGARDAARAPPSLFDSKLGCGDEMVFAVAKRIGHGCEAWSSVPRGEK